MKRRDPLLDLPLMRLDPPTIAGVIPIPMTTREAMNMPRFCEAVSGVSYERHTTRLGRHTHV